MKTPRKRARRAPQPESTPRRVEASEARAEFATLLNQVAFGGEQIIVRRHGKDLAAIIPVEDLQFYEDLEDYALAQAAERTEAESTGAVPFEQWLEEMKRESDALSDRDRTGGGPPTEKTSTGRPRPAD